MRTEVGELKLVFCVNLPPKALHGWLKENAPEFGGWHPTHGRGGVLQLDVDRDADEIAQRWMHAYHYVDLVDRTEVHARCQYFFLAQPFDIFLGKVAARFPETRAALREELEDPYLARNLPHLREVLESIAAEPDTSTPPISVINIGSIAHSFNTSLGAVPVDVSVVETADDIGADPAPPSKQSDDTEANESQRASYEEESTENETATQESPTRQIVGARDRAIVVWLLKGYSDNVIAQKVGFSRKTVSNRISKLRRMHPDMVPTRVQLSQDPSLAERLLESIGLHALSGSNRELAGNQRELAGNNRDSL